MFKLALMGQRRELSKPTKPDPESKEIRESACPRFPVSLFRFSRLAQVFTTHTAATWRNFHLEVAKAPGFA
jgi:hypothetical protein